MIDRGTQKSNFNGELRERREVQIGWELINEKMEDGRPFVASKIYTLSASQKSNLRKDLENWRAKKFTDEELETFDLTKLLGVPAMLTMAETEKDGNKRTNITAVSALPKGTQLQPLVNDKLAVILSPEDFKPDQFAKLHEKTRETIAKSPEYQAIKSGKPMPQHATAGELDDEIPF